MSNVIHMPPRGRYFAAEVGQLAGVSGDRIGQWARRGYIRSSQSSRTPRVYSFQDVAEAMVVHELLENDVPLPSIKRAIESLRETHGDWPLTAASLLVGAGRVYADSFGGQWDVGDRGWHQVLKVDNLRKIAEDLHRGGWAVRQVPDLRFIEVDPERLSGRPAIRGRRIAAEDVAQLAEEAGEDVLREDYGLNADEIRDARRWWRAVQEYEPVAA
ncbi:MAG: hypothetical protein QOH72_5509 [Solirubrobacteraceae bacterium]|jgi:uncharacterized protein (DUF433 family)|nr:hypothetical protein [Solirubrobacteraceae bacterium]